MSTLRTAPHLRDCFLAALGYVALCPDLFWRQEPGIQITDKTDAEWQKAFQLFGGFDIDKGIGD
nr:dienelactone hydrolase family protein [Dokdonella sp.]